MTLVYLAVAWIAGICFAQAIRPPWQLVPLIAFACFVGLLLSWDDHRLRLAWLCLLTGALGAGRLLLAIPRFDDRSLATYNDAGRMTLEGIVVGEPDEREPYTNLRVRMRQLTLADGTKREVEGLALVQTNRYPRRGYGDHLCITGELKAPPVYDGFSYREYLARQGIYSFMRRAQIDLLEDGRDRSLVAHLFAVKRHAQHVIARMLPEPQAALLSGILLGVDTGIPDEIMEDFAATGTSHIIVISGFNITIVAGMFAGIAGRVLHRRWALLTAMVAVAVYTLLVGASPAVVRAAAMGVLYLFGRYVGRKSHAPVSLAAAALLMTAWNPYSLWDLGLQLSFAATAGLVIYTRPLEAWGERVMRRFVPAERTRQVVTLTSEALLVTVAAQVVTAPLLLRSSGQLSPVTLLSNALILPAQSYVMLFGGAATVVGLFVQPLGQVIAWVAWLFLTYTLEVVQLTSPLGGTPLFGSLPNSAVWGYYVMLGGTTWWLTRPRRWRDEMWVRLRCWLSSRLDAKLSIGFSVVLLVLGCLAWRSLPDGRLHVHFLDVGQGDAIFIRTPSGGQALIDGGPSSSVLLWRLGKRMPFWDRSLDLLILTHPDEDHITGLIEVLERYDVEVVVFREMGCQSTLCKHWNQLLTETGVTTYQGQAGLNVTLDDRVLIETLHPGSDLLATDEFNDNSIVVRLTYGEASFLLTGDIEAQSEGKLMGEGASRGSTVLK
ncbi:MAG: ComEC/Rec2 family competence protein, partial [Chloroflexota bacterium]